MILNNFDKIKTTTLDNERILSEDEIDKIQRVLLSMCTDIMSFCEQNNLNVYLGGGSALGAVRHKGFIPWDDDIDLNILRLDYDFFVNNFCKEFNNKYTIKTYPEDGKSSSAKIIKNGTEFISSLDMSDNMGINIDLFVIENTFDNVILRVFHGIGCYISKFICSCKFYGNVDIDTMQLYRKANISLYRSLIIKSYIGKILFLLPIDLAYKNKVRLYSICGNSESKYVTIPEGRKHFFGELYKRSTFLKKRTIMFEGMEFVITNDYDCYLKKLYGKNYMNIPDVQNRERHGVIRLKFENE